MMSNNIQSDEGQAWLLQCLQAALAPEGSLRSAAEEALRKAASQCGYGVALSKIVLSTDIPYGVRHLAAVVLKQFVKEAWKLDGDSNSPTAPDSAAGIVHPEDKAFIKEFLPNALGDAEGKIRTAVGIVIATIAQKDWPEEWPGLMEFLLRCIRDHSSVNRVHGALRCLSLFADEIDDSQMPALVPVLFPELFTIISAHEVYGASIRRRALVVLHSCISTLGIMSGAFQNETKALISPMLKSWMEQFSVILSRPTTAGDADDWSLKMWALKALMQVVVNFPKLASSHLPVVLQPLWQLFLGCSPVYEAAVINGDAGSADLADSDGGDLSLEAVIIQMFEFLISLIGQPRFRKIVEGSVGDLVYHTIGYMKMTQHQLEVWSSDPNQYICDEDDMTFSCRVSGAMLLEEVVAAFDSKGVAVIQQAVQRRLEEAAMEKLAGKSDWWKMREAAVLAVGTVSESILESKGSSMGSVMTPLLESLLCEDLCSDGDSCPFLRGRALWAAARFLAAVPGDRVVPYLEAAVRGLGKGNPVPIMVGGCKALSQFCPKISEDILRRCLPAIYNGIGGLLQQATDETLHLVLETLLVAVRSDATVAAAMEPSVSPAVLNVWATHVTDPLISVDAVDVIEAIAEVPGCVESLVSNALPALAGVLSTPDLQAPGMVEGALDLLTMLLQKTPPHVVRKAYDASFNSVVELARKSEDNGELQSVSECLSAFLRAAGGVILEWSPAGPDAALKCLLDICGRLLNPDLDASASLYVGGLLIQLLRQVPDRMAPHLGDLVRGLVLRMAKGSTPNLGVQLILVFARLVHLSAPNVGQFADLLASVPVEGHGNALSFVMSHWVEYEDLVQGEYQMKVSSTALALILASSDPRLRAMQVKGHIVKAPGNGIVTRARALSKPDQWTVVSLPGKILGLLADVMRNVEEGHGIAFIEEDDDWEEVGDDDLDEDDELGEADVAATGLDTCPTESNGRSVFQPADGVEGLLSEELEDGDYREDPDAANDLINDIDLQTYLKELIEQFAARDRRAFDDLCKELTEEQKLIVCNMSPMAAA